MRMKIHRKTITVALLRSPFVSTHFSSKQVGVKETFAVHLR